MRMSYWIIQQSKTIQNVYLLDWPFCLKNAKHVAVLHTWSFHLTNHYPWACNPWICVSIFDWIVGCYHFRSIASTMFSVLPTF